MLSEHYCYHCKIKLDWFTETRISHPITEVIMKDSLLTHRPNNIYEFIEGDTQDVITYDYEQVGLVYKCSKCGEVYTIFIY
jgi:hypothetical protein